jgi:hypothetical protein
MKIYLMNFHLSSWLDSASVIDSGVARRVAVIVLQRHPRPPGEGAVPL